MKFKDAVEVAVLLEQSDVDAHAIGSNSMKAKVARVAAPKMGGEKPKASFPKHSINSKPCFRCGQTGHWANNCPNRNSICDKCG